ncbi:hypothetical protein HU200_056270 [Digitaria exilis]|uniref:MATH domain-containing protein n=1 Tax=Digitaria exilis TaxID=1010633 RepID=A0A835ADB2_9POAL|nr:hypothetical protein HU200_056270 [Digitaria exilis]
MLFVIELQRSLVIVLDPKKKGQEEFQDVIDLMNKAWARFREENERPFKEQLHIKLDFLIMYSALIQFNVDNHNDRKNLGYVTFGRLPTFTVGGYEWTLHYYPDGRSEETEGNVSVCPELMSTDNASALLSLTFANEVDRSAWAGSATTALLNSNNQFLFRWPEVRSEVFEQMSLVKNDCLEIQCHICVFRPSQLLKVGLLPEIEVPVSDMLQNLVADHYCMNRLKNICEGILCKCLDMESLMTSVALADQYQCLKLLDACVEFLKYSTMTDMAASQWFKVLQDNHPDVIAEICKAVDDVKD